MSKLDEEIERIRIVKVNLAYELADLVMQITSVPKEKAVEHCRDMMAIARRIQG